MSEAPDMLKSRERPLRVGPQTVLAKLAVEWLELRFTALLRTDTQRLNKAYISAGLISLDINNQAYNLADSGYVA